MDAVDLIILFVDIPLFMIALCLILFIVGSPLIFISEKAPRFTYLFLPWTLAFIKWFQQDHSSFLIAFLKFMWALIPCLNLFYLWDWYFRFITSLTSIVDIPFGFDFLWAKLGIILICIILVIMLIKYKRKQTK